MADTGRPDGTDGTDEGPTLEMPSFSLRRRRKATEEAAPPAPVDAEPAPVVAPVVAPVLEPAVEPAPEPEPRPRRELPTVALSGLPAAAVTGVVVGALALALAWLSTTACDAVRGTPACGGAPGLLILVAVVVVLSYVGSLLLRVLGVPDPGSTSVLAVGILAVLVLVFLLGSIDEWWMVVALPVAAVIGYGASWWITHAVASDDEAVVTPDDRAPHDVR